MNNACNQHDNCQEIAFWQFQLLIGDRKLLLAKKGTDLFFVPFFVEK
jgi:hypothetical protein